MRWDLVFLGIILLSLSRAAAPFLGGGLWWDEVVYLGLAQSLGKGFYSLSPGLPVESFRPPLFPILLAPLSFSLEAMKLLAFAVSLISIFTVYSLARPFGKRPALLATLFFSTSSLFVFSSTKLLTEPLFGAFLSLALLSFFRFQETGKPGSLMLCGLATGLAFLTRYFATILIAALVLSILSQRFSRQFIGGATVPKPTTFHTARDLILFLLPLLLVISPWLLLSQLSYGSPWGAYFANISAYAASVPQSFLQGLWDILGFFTYLLPLLLAFFLFERKKTLSPRLLPLTLLFLLTLATFLAIPHKEARYFLSFLPLFCLLAALGAERLFPVKKVAFFLPPALVLLAFLTFSQGLQASLEDVQATALVDASLYLKEVSAPEDLVLTQSYPFVMVLSERQVITTCELAGTPTFDQCQGRILQEEFPLEQLEATLDRYPVQYVLSSSYEPSNPPASRQVIEQRFDKLKSFPQWGNPEAVVVYKRRN